MALSFGPDGALKRRMVAKLLLRQHRGRGRTGQPAAPRPAPRWSDVNRALRRGDLDPEAALHELIQSGLVRKALGFSDPRGDQHYTLEGFGRFHVPVLLMSRGLYGGARLYAPMHRSIPRAPSAQAEARGGCGGPVSGARLATRLLARVRF